MTTSYKTIRSYLVTARIVLSYILCHYSVTIKEKIGINKTVREVGVLSQLTKVKCVTPTYLPRLCHRVIRS